MLPIAVVTLVLATFGGRVWVQGLRSSRPPTLSTNPFGSRLGIEVVEARLWQDPLVAVRQHDRTGHSKESSHANWGPHQIERLTADIAKRLEDDSTSLRIMPVFTPGSIQSYQIVLIDLDTIDVETAEVKTEVVEEKLSVSWFASAGSLRNQITSEPGTKTLDTIYNAPDTPPEATAGWVTVWLVARDQRGGVAWTSLDILIEPGAPPSRRGRP